MSSKRLRVVHVIDSFAGSGGAENRLVEEVIALDDRFDQVVVRLYERDFLQTKLTDAGIEVISLGFTGARAARTWPLAALKLRRVVRRFRADVVHTSLFNGNLIGQLAATTLGVPVVSTFNHTGERRLQRDLRTGAASWKARLMQSVGRWTERRGDVHYRAVGGYARSTNCEWRGLSLDQATVVHRGVEVAEDQVVIDRSAFGLPDDVPLFVNVARRVPEKAQHLLVAAFAKVRAELPEARLAIAGASGSNDSAVSAAIDHAGLADAVDLLGFRSDARSLVASADVFAFSSRSEGSPGVVVEAMAVGTAVAAFDIPPVAELTDGGRHAWLAPDGSVDDLAKAMLAAYRAPGRAERTEAGRGWAERFRLSAVAQQLGDLLEERAARRDRGDITTGATTKTKGQAA
ncbi:MAG TPA: glycosyltransferase [Acidimicrobiales bacterium]|jgi:glycosyltransferase involved in cell wall biosynthesis